MDEHANNQELSHGSVINKHTMIAVGVAIFFIGGSLYLSFAGFGGGRHSTNKNDSSQQKGALSEIYHVSADNDPFLGKDNAPVTLIEFADFQCPSCAIFHFGAGASIIDTYVKKGLVKMVFRDFPLLGEESYRAAYAAGCANDQGKFWEYHDTLFEKQSKTALENIGAFSLAFLIESAERLNLNRSMFVDCLRTEKYKDEVLRDIEDGKKVGIQGTPVIFINGRKIEGVQPFGVYQAIIDEALLKK